MRQSGLYNSRERRMMVPEVVRVLGQTIIQMSCAFIGVALAGSCKGPLGLVCAVACACGGGWLGGQFGWVCGAIGGGIGAFVGVKLGMQLTPAVQHPGPPHCVP